MGLFGKKKSDDFILFKDIFIVTGLGVPMNTPCNATLKEKVLTIECIGKEYVLDVNLIFNIDYKMDVDINQLAKNGSTHIGCDILGTPIKLSSSTLKTKGKRIVYTSMTISYNGKNGAIIIILAGNPNTLGCPKLYDALKPIITPQKQVIEL